MLFRPEEIHARSPVRSIIRGTADFGVGVPDHFQRIDGEHSLVSHLDRDRFSAIEANGVDSHRFAWEEPANRQRFEPSLGKPTLPSVDGDPVHRRHTVERREGDDVLRARVEPCRYAGVNQLME
jgi:hypothetical protein